MSDGPFELPFQSPAVPELLTGDSLLRFRCQPGISCFNACCKCADVTLAPYDILRLKQRLGLDSEAFLRQYTVPFQMDQDGVPGVKLRTDDSGACLLLAGEAGCGVYADRPLVCRYYPVALLNLREKDALAPVSAYSLVKEPHCLGHLEDREIAIADYREEQGCPQYDEYNRGWYELILKKRSAGPGVGRLSEMSLQLFFMASYDLDRFRRFVASDKFRATYALGDAFFEQVAQDDLLLLDFAYRFLRQVLFGERSIEEAPDAWIKRVDERKEVWDLRAQAEIARRQAEEDRKYRDDV